MSHAVEWIAVATLLVAATAGLVVLLRVARSASGRRPDDRVRREDALKHLHESEYVGQSATLQTLAGALQIDGGEATRLAARLESGGLVELRAGALHLSETGRNYARRVLRRHRLWERYLADRTGLEQADWHLEADRREHTLTPAEVEDLSARMGHPRYDPHGDPIPTEDGDIPPRPGRPLTDFASGSTVRIVHVEDEPDVLYRAITAAGLFPGMTLRIAAAADHGVRLETVNGECRIDPLAAASVTVVELAQSESFEGHRKTLAELAPGESAIVKAISASCRAPERRRLMDLGLVAGTPVELELRSPMGDPMAYRIRGAVIALRREQAARVLIEGDAAAEEAPCPVE